MFYRILLSFALVSVLSLIHCSDVFRHNSCSRGTPFECKCIRKMNITEYQEFMRCQQSLTDLNVRKDGLIYCCALQEYERCVLPLILERCRESGVELFEYQMRSINSLCTFITGNTNKCDSVSIPTPVYGLEDIQK